MRISIALLLSFTGSFLFSQESLLFVYNTGTTISTTQYVKVENKRKHIGTIGFGEYTYSFLDYGVASLVLTRQGLGSKSLNISLNSEVTYLKIEINNGQWSVQKQNEREVSHQVRLLCTSLIQAHEESKISIQESEQTRLSSFINTTGTPPSIQSNLVLISNPSGACCNSSELLILEMISQGLSDRYRVIDRSQLDQVLDEQKLQLSGLTSSENAIEAGQIVGAEYSVISTCTCMDGEPAYSIKFINCESLEVSYSIILQTPRVSNIPAIIKSNFLD